MFVVELLMCLLLSPNIDLDLGKTKIWIGKQDVIFSNRYIEYSNEEKFEMTIQFYTVQDAIEFEKLVNNPSTKNIKFTDFNRRIKSRVLVRHRYEIVFTGWFEDD